MMNLKKAMMNSKKMIIPKYKVCGSVPDFRVLAPLAFISFLSLSGLCLHLSSVFKALCFWLEILDSFSHSTCILCAQDC